MVAFQNAREILEQKKQTKVLNYLVSSMRASFSYFGKAYHAMVEVLPQIENVEMVHAQARSLSLAFQFSA